MTEVFYPSEVVAIGTLMPWPTNYVNHPEIQLEALQASLRLFGQAKNVVVWRSYIVAGHGLVESATRAGWANIEIKRLPDEWTEAQVESYLIADNRTAELSQPDQGKLGSMLKRIRDAGGDVVGYTMQAQTDKLAAMPHHNLLGALTAISNAAPVAQPDGNATTLTAPPTTAGGAVPMVTAPPAANAYVQLQFPMTVEDRAVVLEVLGSVQRAYGVANSIQALIALCQWYRENKPA